MKLIRSVAAGLALLSGAVALMASQPNAHAVAGDYLVRPDVVTQEVSSSQTLSDWQFTDISGGRRPKCRGIR